MLSELYGAIVITVSTSALQAESRGSIPRDSSRALVWGALKILKDRNLHFHSGLKYVVKCIIGSNTRRSGMGLQNPR